MTQSAQRCDDEAEAVDEDAKTSMKRIKLKEEQQQKKYLKIMMKFQKKMWRLQGLLKKGETLQGERNNT